VYPYRASQTYDSRVKTYREKIVDIELNYDPLHEDHIKCVIDKNDAYFSKLLDLIKELDIKNIRVLKKIKWVLDELWEFLENCEQRLIDEWLTHVALFCWSYYQSEDSLSFEYVQNQLHNNSWLSLLSKETNEDDENSNKFNSIAINLSLKSAIYDDDIVKLLKYGFFDKEQFSVKIKNVSSEIESNIISENLNHVWGFFSESFDDNLEEIKKELIAILENDLEKVKLNDFSSIIEFLGLIIRWATYVMTKYRALSTICNPNLIL